MQLIKDTSKLRTLGMGDPPEHTDASDTFTYHKNNSYYEMCEILVNIFLYERLRTSDSLTKYSLLVQNLNTEMHFTL
jgi:hypothetical protein